MLVYQRVYSTIGLIDEFSTPADASLVASMFSKSSKPPWPAIIMENPELEWIYGHLFHTSFFSRSIFLSHSFRAPFPWFIGCKGFLQTKTYWDTVIITMTQYRVVHLYPNYLQFHKAK